MPELNETIHQTVRLRIMAALVALDPKAEVDFTTLRSLLDVTDGNLGAHLKNWKKLNIFRLIKLTSIANPALLCR